MTTEYPAPGGDLPDGRLNPFRLARLADCGTPDNNGSPGALFLTQVQGNVREALRYDPTAFSGDDGNDQLHRIADESVPILTYERWLVFVDLAAWQEDVTEYGGEDDLTTAAGVALYMIALRLAEALVQGLVES